MPSRIGVYAGSFDPPHLGHFDVMRRGCAIFGEVVVALGVHPGKTPFLDVATRAVLIAEHAEEHGLNLRVTRFDGLVTAHARAVGAGAILRGLRNAGDLTYEMEMAGMNAAMAPEIETVFLAARPELSAISGTQIRQIARMRGPVGPFVTDSVEAALRQRLNEDANGQ